MMHYGSVTPKRSKGFSNNRFVLNYNLGRLKKSSAKVPEDRKTIKKYVDKSGKQRFVGTKALKQTQNLVLN